MPDDEEVKGNYIKAADIDNWPAGTTDEQKAALIAWVEETIERITQDEFYEKSFDIKVSGNGKPRIFLPSMPKVLLVSSVEVDGEALDGIWSFNEYSVFRTDDGVFAIGVDNVRIQGKRGWKPVPYDIQQAALILIRDHNDPTLYQHMHKGSRSLGDYRYDYDGPVYTGVLEADKILYRRINRRGSFL